MRNPEMLERAGGERAPKDRSQVVKAIGKAAVKGAKQK
jgi:hypothetical protein